MKNNISKWWSTITPINTDLKINPREVMVVMFAWEQVPLTIPRVRPTTLYNSYLLFLRQEAKVILRKDFDMSEHDRKLRNNTNDLRFVFTSSCFSYLHYVCLLAYSDVQHIIVLCSCFVFSMLLVFLDCSFWLPLRYSLTCIYC